jgi:hypothetical protein
VDVVDVGRSSVRISYYNAFFEFRFYGIALIYNDVSKGFFLLRTYYFIMKTLPNLDGLWLERQLSWVL